VLLIDKRRYNYISVQLLCTSAIHSSCGGAEGQGKAGNRSAGEFRAPFGSMHPLHLHLLTLPAGAPHVCCSTRRVTGHSHCATGGP
jgi:hypothetical protein